ncbi:MAG: HTH-type transcriptional regulator NsrR [Pseudomonadota bacterium]|jgi:Rrf2 family nitric oxide-sensitive transcriptional repressor
MRLTSFTDYTLRVLMYLALNTERLATIQEIANAYGISESHLTKVVHHLAKTGDVESVRGKGGGIRLARPASEIRIGQIIKRAEGDAPIVECMQEGGNCRITPACKLAKILSKAFSSLYASLDEYTLADLTRQPEALVRFLTNDTHHN